MAGRKPYKPTEADIETVRALKETGASDKACYEAIGVSNYTWNKYKNSLFSLPIKEAQKTVAKREITKRERLLALAEQTLEKEIKGYWIEEETTTTKTIGGEEYVETKVQKKWMRPNTPMNIMTLVNSSDTKSEIDWQPANKVENTIINNNDLPSIKLEWTEPKG